MHISELQHQIDTQQLDALKGLHQPPSSTGTGEGRMTSYQHKSYSHVSLRKTATTAHFILKYLNLLINLL